MGKTFEERLREWEEVAREEAAKKDAARPRYYAGQCRLIRFSDYEFDSKRGLIVRTPNSHIEWYRPFDYEPAMLIDYLEVISSIRGITNHEDRLTLCYMGDYLTHKLPRTEDEKKVLVEEKRADLEKDHPWEHQRRTSQLLVEKAINAPILTPVIEQQFQTRFNRDIPLILDFHRKYGRFGAIASDPFGWRDVEPELAKLIEKEDLKRDDGHAISQGMSPWYPTVGEPDETLEVFEAWHEYRSGTTQLNQERLLFLICGHHVDVELGVILHKGTFRLDYIVNTVSIAIAIMLINNMTSGGEQIRKCALDDCYRFFLTPDMRAKYCGPKHSQLGRVRAYRKRQKAGEVKSEGELSRKHGKTRGK